jgi:hypothetical protein
MRRKMICPLLCALFAFCAVGTLHAQGTAFMYQGRLNDGGSPATGLYDLRFQIYDAVTNGNAITVPLTNSATAVSNGLFTATLDFGAGVFTGRNCWLDIGVRTNGGTNGFAILSPRQPVLPVPYAIFANSASNLLGMLPTAQLSGTLSTTQLNGTLPAAQLSGTLPASAFAGYTNTVSLTNGLNLFAGAFSGNGASITNVNMTNLTGVLSDSQLPTNTAFVNSNQTFSGANSLTNWGNNFVGSFFGNGLVGWIVTNGTAIQAQIDHGYVLTNSQLATLTLPTNANVGDILRISGVGAGGWKIAQNTNQSVIGIFSSFAGSPWTLTSASSLDNWDSIASSSDGSKLIASIYSGGVYASTDFGTTWTETNLTVGDWRSVACSANGGKLFAALYGTGIYTNSATGWGIGGSTSGLNWISVACSSDGSKLVAAVYGGGVYTSANSGATWKQQTTGLPSNPNWFCVASSANGTNLVAVVYGGGIYTSANAGASWAQQTTGLPSNPNWDSVASSADGTKLAAAVYGGSIYTSVNSGANWSRQTNGAPASLNWECIASSSDGNKLAAVVGGGLIYFSSNSGLTWVQADAASNNWYSVTFSSDGSKLAAAVYGGGIYTSQLSSQTTTTTTGINGYMSGGPDTTVELQYIGNGQFMTLNSFGTIWGY